MTRQSINYGTNPNDGTGDTLRVAMDKVNDNFVELYDSLVQDISLDTDRLVNSTANGNISLEVSGTGTIQTTQGLLVNTEHQNLNSIFYSHDTNPLLTVDVLNNRIAVNKATPSTTLDVDGDASFSGNVSATASVTFGTTSTDRLTLNSKVFGNIVSGISGSIGESGNPWTDVYAESIDATSISVANISATRISATEFTGDVVGNLITSSDITINNGILSTRINTKTLTDPRTIDFPDLNGTVVTKNNGRMAGPFGTAPATSVGASGDAQGDIAFDANYMYYCVAEYDGSTTIWKRSALNTW